MLTDEQISKIITDLETLPDAIKSLSTAYLDNKSRLESLDFEIENIRLNTLNAVSEQMDGDKPRYSNDIKRKKATEDILHSDKIYIEMTTELKELKRKLLQDEVNIDFLKHKLRATESTVLLLGGRR